MVSLQSQALILLTGMMALCPSLLGPQFWTSFGSDKLVMGMQGLLGTLL